MSTMTATPLPLSSHRAEDRDILRHEYAVALADAHRSIPGATERLALIAERLAVGNIPVHDLKALANAVEDHQYVNSRERKAEIKKVEQAERHVRDCQRALDDAHVALTEANRLRRDAVEAVKQTTARQARLAKAMNSKAIKTAFEIIVK